MSAAPAEPPAEPPAGEPSRNNHSIDEVKAPEPSTPKPPQTNGDAIGSTLGLEKPDIATTESLSAREQLENEIKDALEGRSGAQGAPKDKLIDLCKIIDFWLGEGTANLKLIDDFGLASLRKEVKRDYVLSSLLAWRGEYKLACITLRSFLESFCLLLYYLNQGCDRLLYLRGKGYKLMLHRMAQKKPVVDDMHAFRRHYHLLIEEGRESAGEKHADNFFKEIDACYDILSKAVHGDFSPKKGVPLSETYLEIAKRVLVICNTLALHDPMLDATEDDLITETKDVLNPCIFGGKLT